MHFDEVTTLCKYCGNHTKMHATMMCDRCWSFDKALDLVEPGPRDAILADHGLLVVSDQLPPFNWEPPTEEDPA